MDHDRQETLRELEERLSRVSGWLAGRGEQATRWLRTRLESVQRDVSRARRAGAQDLRDAVASARATLDDMDRDYGAPPAHVALHPEELRALRHHLQLTAGLLPHLSNLDDPGWDRAREEYDRSWVEVRRAFEEEGGAAAR